MGACKNLIDLTFNRLTVVEKTDKRDSCGSVIWNCLCSCGNENFVEVSTRQLKSSGIQSCGCLKKENLKKTIGLNLQQGDRFGRLVVINETEKRNKEGSVLTKCLCDCGKTVLVPNRDLKRGHTQSCGCLKSKGELIVAEKLLKYNINFIQQYGFTDCINPKTNCPLKFDFYLPDYNICIEYDGIQHFEETFYSHDCLDDIQYRDNLKNQYCLENNITLLRFKYTQSDTEMEEIIKTIQNKESGG